MPRHKQPEEVARLKGAHRDNPARYRNRPAKHPDSVGRAPAYLRKEAKRAWNELVKWSLPGVLSATDRPTLEVFANLLADFRDAPSEFPAPKIASMLTCIGRLGMTPSDRQKIIMAKQPQQVNPMAEFVDAQPRRVPAAPRDFN